MSNPNRYPKVETQQALVLRQGQDKKNAFVLWAPSSDII